jgi:hypothetical protein
VGHTRVPQLETGDLQVARGEQHEPPHGDEPRRREVCPWNLDRLGKHRDAIEPVDIEVPLGGLRQRIGVEKITADDHGGGRKWSVSATRPLLGHAPSCMAAAGKTMSP